jgi:hypothetical protein
MFVTREFGKSQKQIRPSVVASGTVIAFHEKHAVRKYGTVAQPRDVVRVGVLPVSEDIPHSFGETLRMTLSAYLGYENGRPRSIVR